MYNAPAAAASLNPLRWVKEHNMTWPLLRLFVTALILTNCVGLRAQQANLQDEARLRQAVENFIAAADKGDAKSVAAMYDNGFTNVRVADEGGLVKLSREQ